ncbi:MAG: response regulator [Lachnospiraceae bacterium]|nr:response regulator [Lachnospiraceae bacterium]
MGNELKERFKRSRVQGSRAWRVILGLYFVAAVTGIFARILLQNEMIGTVERNLASYAELGVIEITDVGNNVEGLSDLGYFLEKRYQNIAYMGVDNKIGSVIISANSFFQGKVPGELGDSLKAISDSISEGEALAEYHNIRGLGKYFLFSALSPDGRYSFKGYVPYDDAMRDLKAIRGVFVTAVVLLILVATCTGIVILRLDAKAEKMEEAERARKRAEDANQAKSSFLANMSHEIRTPINAILGMNEMIFRETSESNIRDYSRNVNAAASNLLSIVSDILDFSKIEAGKLELIEDKYELSSMLHDIYQMIRMRAENKGLAFEMKVDETIPEMLYGDRLRVQQCIMNLLVNAVKYTDKGKVTLDVSYNMPDEKTVMLIVRVTDTGKGIPEDQQKAIFDKFQRVDMKSNNTIEGTGLGLSITQNLLDIMGGSIKINSVYGAGSVFTVSIPQMYLGTEPVGNIENRIKSEPGYKNITESSFVAPTANVLVVDDTELNLVVAKNLLKKTEIRVDTALSGSECLEKLKEKQYDVIFLDARMPEMDGVETLNNIKSMGLCPKETAIIVLTANVLAGAKSSYMDMGFDEYLPKPVKPEDLEAMLLRFLPADKVELTDAVREETDYSGIPDWIRKNPELDIRRGIELCGSPEIYMDTITRFEKYAMDTIKDIGGAFGQGRIEDFTTKVHSVKSSAKLIGAERLSALAAELEEAGDRKDVPFIGAHIGTMLSLYGEIAESLSPLVKEEKKEGEVEPEALRGIYAHLKNYVDDFNSEAVGSMVRALDRYQFPGSEQKRFDELKRAYEAMDWVAMMAVFDDWEEEDGE